MKPKLECDSQMYSPFQTMLTIIMEATQVGEFSLFLTAAIYQEFSLLNRASIAEHFSRSKQLPSFFFSGSFSQAQMKPYAKVYQGNLLAGQKFVVDD